ncbi:MAG: TIR domain-containing protein [Prevotella sp.]|nr:TIR domain-containing protein [Prevotella sp.]
MTHDIFISYSSKQKSIADGVCHYLEENGFKCWMAPRDIPDESEYGDMIEEVVRICKVVVLVFSETFPASDGGQFDKDLNEIDIAFAEHKPILTFHIAESEVKGGFREMLNQMHWIDAYPHYADRLPNLLKSISGLLGRPAKNVNAQGDTTKIDETITGKPSCSEKLTNSFNGHEFVDLGLSSGTLWATCNVGASNPEDYGDYFAWGETAPKEIWSESKYKYSANIGLYKLTKYCSKSDLGNNDYTDNLTVLLGEDDPAMTNWGDGWHTPTKAQWEELLDNTTKTWTTQNGVNGWLFTAKNGQTIFLPAAGRLRWGSVFENAELGGYYWSSSLDVDHPSIAWHLSFSSGSLRVRDDHGRDNGLPIRPVR